MSEKSLAIDLRKSNLSSREITISTYVLKGLSNKEIAGRLLLTEKSIKWHLTNIYRKLKMNMAGTPRVYFMYCYGHYLNEEHKPSHVPIQTYEKVALSNFFTPPPVKRKLSRPAEPGIILPIGLKK